MLKNIIKGLFIQALFLYGFFVCYNSAPLTFELGFKNDRGVGAFHSFEITYVI
jgi:hypothetical protein